MRYDKKKCSLILETSFKGVGDQKWTNQPKIYSSKKYNSTITDIQNISNGSRYEYFFNLDKGIVYIMFGCFNFRNNINKLVFNFLL